MNNLIGQHLGAYRVLEQIGTGGMATVYKAYQPAMDRYVAVKVIASHFAQDQTFLRRFRREARAVAQLEHAHILPVYDSGEAEGRPYLVMRYLKAGTLKDRLAEGLLSLSEVNHIIGQVGSALDYAHRMGVIHRDVKPTNVLLDAEGDTFLTDFGLAKMVASSVQLTGTGVGIGTPAYMSPEQGKGAKIDSRTDVYSLGVMLYEMVTGRMPYEAETPLAVVIKHITEPLPLPRSVRPDLPEEVERVILRAMAKEPDDRFQTAGEMVRALDAAVRASEAAARTEPAVVEMVRAEPAVAEVTAVPAEVPRARAVVDVREAMPVGWGRTAAWVAIGIVALVALFLILNLVPLRVQISDGQLEVVRVVEETATSTLQPTITPVPPLTPVPAEMLATAISPPPPALQWEQLADATSFLPAATNALAVDPNDPDVVFAGTYGAGIYVSRDGGHTWTPSNQGLGKGTVGSIVIDPNGSNVVYTALFDQGGVYRSTDGGQTWQAANTGIDLDRAWDWGALVYIDPTDSQRLYYTGTSDGFYLSTNGGQSWRRQSSHCPQVMDFFVDPADFEHLYAASHEDANLECRAGVYETTDGGRTWEWLTPPAIVTPDEWGDDAWHVTADPRDFDTVYAGGWTSTFKSSDGGRTWTQILGENCQWLAVNPESGAVYCVQGGQMRISRDGGASWSSVGLGGWSGWNSRPFAIAPSAPQTLYAGSDVVLKSTDGGETWLRVGWLGAARMQLTVDPRDGKRLFLGGRDSPCETYRSENGGEIWQVIATDDGGCPVIIDPVQDVLYRPGRSQGLYRSRDGGQTWEQFGSGYRDAWQLVPDPQDSLKLWLTEGCSKRPLLSQDGGVTFVEVESFPQTICGDPILLAHLDGKRVYVESNGSIYRSDDGGETWRLLAELGGMYRAAVLDPSDPNVVYYGSTHKGVLKTLNGGHTWHQMNAGLTDSSINELVIDPGDPQTIYAATDGGAFVSVDGGENWSPIQEELGSNPVVYSIAVNPNDPSRVYAATPDGIFRLVGAPPEAAAAPTPAPGSPADQAHAFAKPILAAIADRPPDYEDDFSDPGSGWPSRSTTDGDQWGYEDNAYSILVAPGYHDVGVLPDRPLELSDLVLEVDVQFISGEWGHWYVSFRHSPGFVEQPAGAYSVKFYPDGSFDLWKNVGGISGELIEEDAVYAPSFEQRTGINRLTLIAQGPQIAIYMNGEPLWFVRDESLEKGTVMLAVGNETDSSTLRVHFDNFKVWDISGLPLSTPAP